MEERVAMMLGEEACSENTEGEIIMLSRDFLEACLEERFSQEENPLVLDSRQREFLELIAASAAFRDVIVVPKELLDAFLAGQGGVPSSTKMSAFESNSAP